MLNSIDTVVRIKRLASIATHEGCRHSYYDLGIFLRERGLSAEAIIAFELVPIMSTHYDVAFQNAGAIRAAMTSSTAPIVSSIVISQTPQTRTTVKRTHDSIEVLDDACIFVEKKPRYVEPTLKRANKSDENGQENVIATNNNDDDDNDNQTQNNATVEPTRKSRKKR